MTNHCNLKVPPMDEETFIERYIRHLDMIKNKHLSSFVVRYEALVGKDPDHIQRFEEFLGSKIDKTIIKPK